MYELPKYVLCCFKKILETAPHKIAVFTATYFPSRKPSKQDEKDVLGIAREVMTNISAKFSDRLLRIDTPVLTDH